MSGLALLLALLGPPRVAIALPASETLAQAWIAGETRLACLYGHVGTYQGVPAVWVDSVEIAPACGSPAIGMLGFLHDNAAEQSDVLRAMAAVLMVRTEFLIVGEVHAVTRTVYDGAWYTVPLAWWAIREPEPSTARQT